MAKTLRNETAASSTIALINEFSTIGANEQGVTRLAYTELDMTAKLKFIKLCEQEGMHTRIDEAGNVIARREGIGTEKSAVAFGSHLDTVVHAGRYDGTLGVFSGLEIIRMMNHRNIETKYPVELIAFASEESSRFGIATIGSKAMAGILDLEVLAHAKDKSGTSFPDAVSSQGLNFENLKHAKRDPTDLKAFIELHIEQGPFLEKQGIQIGVVTSIAAPTRYRIEIVGQAGHSGTTHMNMRKDALTAAAEIVLAVESLAVQEQTNYSVGTVGALQVVPGTANTVPGKVELIAEFRSNNKESKEKLKTELLAKIDEVRTRRDLIIHTHLIGDEQPVLMDSSIRKVIRDSCEDIGFSFVEMTSGAGHDAMNLALLCPTGMLFVPSMNGLSHHPDEFTDAQDINSGILALYESIMRLAEPVTV